MNTKILKKKLIASLLIVMMLLNMFSPYTNISLAATAEEPDKPCVILRKSSDIKTSGSNRYFTVDVVLTSYDKECFYTNVDINLNYDASKIKLCRRSGNTSTKYTEATQISQALLVGDGAYETNYGETMTYVNTTQNWFRLYLSNIAPESPNWYDGEMTIATLYFRVEDSSLTDDNIESVALFTPRMNTLTGGMQGYIEIDYSPDPSIVTDESEFLDSIVYDVNSAYLGTDGLAPIGEAAPVVSSIAVKTLPSDTEYDHGENINLTDGVITVIYDDGTEEEVSMTDSKVSITSGSEADVANPKVTISYEGKEATFDITVNDPIKTLEVYTPMNNTEYEHEDDFDFTGLQLKATKNSGATEILTKDSDGVTTSSTVADVNSDDFVQTSADGVVPVSGIQTIKFTYEGKEAKQTVTVNDTIESIAVVSQPTKDVYKRGEELKLEGASVKLTLGSGGDVDIDLPDGSITVTGYNKNSTGAVQNLTVKMGDITSEDTIDVEVYNYVTSSSIIAPSNITPEVNTDLDLTGAKIKLNWHDGTSTNVGITDSMILRV